MSEAANGSGFPAGKLVDALPGEEPRDAEERKSPGAWRLETRRGLDWPHRDLSEGREGGSGAPPLFDPSLVLLYGAAAASWELLFFGGLGMKETVGTFPFQGLRWQSHRVKSMGNLEPHGSFLGGSRALIPLISDMGVTSEGPAAAQANAAGSRRGAGFAEEGGSHGFRETLFGPGRVCASAGRRPGKTPSNSRQKEAGVCTDHGKSPGCHRGLTHLQRTHHGEKPYRRTGCKKSPESHPPPANSQPARAELPRERICHPEAMAWRRTLVVEDVKAEKWG